MYGCNIYADLCLHTKLGYFYQSLWCLNIHILYNLLNYSTVKLPLTVIVGCGGYTAVNLMGGWQKC